MTETRTAGETIDVWWADLDGDLAPERLQVLARDEIVAAEALRQPRERHRRLATRCFVREVLALRLGTTPAAIVFHRHPAGKPMIAAPAGSDLEFSLSHTAAIAVLATAAARPIGIDAEFHDPVLPLREIAASRCTAEAWRRLAPLPDDALGRAFLRLWVRREAMAKAAGDGLGDGRAIGGEPATGWCCDLAAPEGYVAALAAAGPAEATIRTHHWRQ